jgi:uncharacterized RDD family membrane protein YckC
MTVLSALLYVGVFALSFAAFTGARYLTAAAFRVPDLLRPFGEAPASSYARGRFGARPAIAVAGLLGVYVVAAAFAVTGWLMQGEVVEPGTTVDVRPSSPAEEAGFLSGDRVTAINGAPIKKWKELADTVQSHPGEELDFTVERGGSELHLSVTPGPKGTPSQGKIGVSVRAGAQHREPLSVFEAASRGLRVPLTAIGEWLEGMDRLIFGTEGELAGPVAIMKEVTRARDQSVGFMLIALSIMISMGCVPVLAVASLVLLPFGVKRAADSPIHRAPEVGGEPERASVWARAGARLFDFLLVVVPLTVLYEASGIGALDAWLRVYLFLLWIPVEAALLSLWGFTPGKWLFKVSVRSSEGGRLSFAQAHRRAAGVWVWGLGAWLSFVILVVASLALARHRRRGAAYWDELDGFRVLKGRSAPA